LRQCANQQMPQDRSLGQVTVAICGPFGGLGTACRGYPREKEAGT
jgi:hypothetical protein